jgi:hypothetical protein
LGILEDVCNNESPTTKHTCLGSKLTQDRPFRMSIQAGSWRAGNFPTIRMSTFPQTDSSPTQIPRKPPSGDLPPVEPPTVGFILQLFVIPMVIVTIIVVIWLLFNWLAHMGSNPTELVQDLRKPNDARWQKALTLADLLRNPHNTHLKKDRALAKGLADVLNDEMQAARMDETPIQLRVFLCRALGEFETPEVLESLLQAARTEREPIEVQVRRSAIQSLAVYISNNEPENLHSHSDLLAVLLDAARARSDSDAENAKAELRSTAAFALGLLGSREALDQLDVLLGDAYPNARYNAAVALCRQGDARALPVLAEMLDPENEESVSREPDEEGKPWKRLLVMENGIRAAGQLVEKNQGDDLTALDAALEKIEKSDLTKFKSGARRGIRIEANEVRIKLKERAKPAAASAT